MLKQPKERSHLRNHVTECCNRSNESNDCCYCRLLPHESRIKSLVRTEENWIDTLANARATRY